MIKFKFIVGKAFLNYFHRPITVPKSQVDYEVVETEIFTTQDLRVICPNGERMAGSLVYSKAGYGPYYQIRIEGGSNDPLSRISIGQTLIVEIEKIGTVIEVRLNCSQGNHIH